MAVDRHGLARGPAARAEVNGLSVPPEQGVIRLAVLSPAAGTDGIAVRVDRDGRAVAAAPAQVDQLPATEEERASGDAGPVAVADDVAPLVDGDRRHLEPAKPAEVVELPPRRRSRRALRSGDPEGKRRRQDRRCDASDEP